MIDAGWTCFVGYDMVRRLFALLHMAAVYKANN